MKWLREEVKKTCKDMKIAFLDNMEKEEKEKWVKELEKALSAEREKEIRSFIESFNKRLSDLLFTSEKREELFNEFYTIGTEKLEEMKNENNENVNQKIKQGYVLARKERFLAIGLHQLDAFKNLIKNENDQNKIKELLYFSAIRGNEEILDHLISKCPLKNKEIYYCLLEGIEKENVAGIKAMITLMDKRKSPLVFNSGYIFKTSNDSYYSVEKNTPLIHWAIIYKQPAIVELLIDKSGKKLAHQNEAGENVLHLIATHWTKEKWVEGEPKELVNQSREVYEELRKKHIESTISLIVQKLPDIISVQNANGATALEQANRVNNQFAIQSLSKATIQTQKPNDATTLIQANIVSYESAIQSLNQKKADAFIPTDHVEENNDSPQESLPFFLDLKTLMKQRNDSGRTVLHWAAMNDHQNEVNTLLYGCNNIQDLLAKDTNRQTAFHVAAQKGHREIARKIYEKIISLNKDHITETEEQKEKIVSALMQLARYQWSREIAGVYQGLTWFNYMKGSYTKQEKCVAADILIEVMIGQNSIANLSDYTGALTQGRLGSITRKLMNAKFGNSAYDDLVKKASDNRSLPLKKLNRYLDMRLSGGEYQGLTWYNHLKGGYTKEEKCKAARALRKVLLGKKLMSSLHDYTDPLTQGRLGALARELIDNQFGKGTYKENIVRVKKQRASI